MNRRCLERCLSLLILLVAVVFAARELPELFTLGDDTSNDAVLLETDRPGTSARSLSATERLTPGLTSQIVAANLPRIPARPSAPDRSRKAGPDLLRLLSLQRK